MYEVLERHSLQENKAVQHPKIPFVFIKGKEYFCLKHPELHLNRGSMKQHVEGKSHRRNFKTGKRITKAKNLPIDVEKYVKEYETQESSKELVVENDSLEVLDMQLERIFNHKNQRIAYLLAKYGLKGQLSEDVIRLIFSKIWRNINEGIYKIEKASSLELARLKNKTIQEKRRKFSFLYYQLG